MPGVQKQHRKREFNGRRFPASHYDDWRGGRASGLERNVLRYRPANVGRIRKGAPADLVLVDLKSPVRIDADALTSKSKNSPFDGRMLTGRVVKTWVDGRLVHQA